MHPLGFHNKWFILNSIHKCTLLSKHTYVNINPGIRDSQTDIIGHRYIDTVDPRIIEGVSEDELAVFRGAHGIADGHNWHTTVCI